MGLIGSALAGGMVGFGNAAVQVGMQQMKEQAQTEREQAAAVRAASLAKLERDYRDSAAETAAANAEKRAIAAEGRKVSGQYVDPETRYPVTNDEIAKRRADFALAQKEQSAIDSAALDAADKRSRALVYTTSPEKRSMLSDVSPEQRKHLEKMQDDEQKTIAEKEFDDAVKDFEGRKKVDKPKGLIDIKREEKEELHELERQKAVAVARIKQETDLKEAQIRANASRDNNRDSTNATIGAARIAAASRSEIADKRIENRPETKAEAEERLVKEAEQKAAARTAEAEALAAAKAAIVKGKLRPAFNVSDTEAREYIAAKGNKPAQRSNTTATGDGKTIQYNGKTYPVAADGTVLINGQKFRPKKVN